MSEKPAASATATPTTKSVASVAFRAGDIEPWLLWSGVAKNQPALIASGRPKEARSRSTFRPPLGLYTSSDSCARGIAKFGSARHSGRRGTIQRRKTSAMSGGPAHRRSVARGERSARTSPARKHASGATREAGQR